jgi:hypothetical protein
VSNYGQDEVLEEDSNGDEELGATVFSDGGSTSSAASLGAQAGLNYFQKRKANELQFSGTARIAGAYMIGSGSSGYDVRIGNFFGPKFSIIGLQTGPDIFQNQFTFGDTTLAPTLGMDWPLITTLYLGPIDLYGGLQPTAFFSGNRPGVNWSQESAFGFGSEFTWLAGASLDAGPIGLSVTYTRRITAFGPQQGFGLGIRL